MLLYCSMLQFRFNSHRHLKRTIGSALNHPLKTPQLWIDYFDPFNCECRVYGRLREEGREDLAVRAYGYLLLSKNARSLDAALPLILVIRILTTIPLVGRWNPWSGTVPSTLLSRPL